MHVRGPSATAHHRSLAHSSIRQNFECAWYGEPQLGFSAYMERREGTELPVGFSQQPPKSKSKNWGGKAVSRAVRLGKVNRDGDY